MPIFEYKCDACGEDFDLLVSSSTKIECKKCGSSEVKKKLSVFGFQNKSAPSAPSCASACGSGFNEGQCGSGLCGGGR